MHSDFIFLGVPSKNDYADIIHLMITVVSNNLKYNDSIQRP